MSSSLQIVTMFSATSLRSRHMINIEIVGQASVKPCAGGIVSWKREK